MRAEAIEAMCRAVIRDYGGPFYTDDAIQAEKMGKALDALLSPRVVPCSEPGCGGQGKVPVPSLRGNGVREVDCDACNGTGQVSLPPLAVLMGELEQVGWQNSLGSVGPMRNGRGIPVYRIASGESSP